MLTVYALYSPSRGWLSKNGWQKVWSDPDLPRTLKGARRVANFWYRGYVYASVPDIQIVPIQIPEPVVLLE